MDERSKAEYESQAQALRADLKKWESDWVKAHGSKPGRDDIKANPDIASKYKHYNKLRDIICGKVPPPTSTTEDQSRSRKRHSGPAPSETPVKRSKHAETPSKSRMNDQDLMNTPSISRKLFSPGAVSTLGPTPQRDGRVLGLFDLLVEKELGTPSKDAESPHKKTRGDVQATPSKRPLSTDDETKLGRTPMSSSKRQRLNNFMTPLKNRDKNVGDTTPSSVSKLQFDTPAFLKRHSLPTLDESGEFDAPAPLRLPRKPLVRGLSEIVASLRRVEEEELDDELDALREAEMEAAGGAPKSNPVVPPKQDVLGKDTQNLPLGGFDDEGMYDSQPEEELGRDGNPMRIFKKKGQKRTTRRVNMRPTRTKRPSELLEKPGSDDELADTVPETQEGDGEAPFDPADMDSDSELETKAQKKSATKPAKKEGTVRKAARKVNELAHANFHRLKLRNYGAKGGPGYNSRFRRRR